MVTDILVGLCNWLLSHKFIVCCVTVVAAAEKITFIIFLLIIF